MFINLPLLFGGETGVGVTRTPETFGHSVGGVRIAPVSGNKLARTSRRIRSGAQCERSFAAVNFRLKERL